MSRLIVRSAGPLSGAGRVPGDKSISHRALMLGALAEGVSRVAGFLPSGDCLATLDCLRALGIEIQIEDGAGRDAPTVLIHGRGLHGLRAPAAPLNCVRSGTSMRLLAGILAGQRFASVLTGEPQLLRRPMRRITAPLRAMGAQIDDVEGHGPLTVRAGALRGIEHALTVASAQVKSAILLAGLYAEGPTVVRQPGPARDHTERMLWAQTGGESANRQISPSANRQIGRSANRKLQMTNYESANHGSRITDHGSPITDHESPIAFDEELVLLNPARIDRLEPLDMAVPGDVSSAAFPLVAALLVPGSCVKLTGVGVNPTRTGLLDVLRAMGAELALAEERQQGGEPVADVTARAGALIGGEVGGSTVVRMIDEFPVLAVAATQARGTTVVRDARELRVKETDRIAVMAQELRKLGAHIEPRPDGFVVQGPVRLRGGTVDSHGDHRIGMALAVAGLIAEGEVAVERAACIADSFPGFVSVMRALGAEMRAHEAT